MSYARTFNRQFSLLAADERINVWHFSIYMALFHKWALNDFKNPFSISRREILSQTHIGSFMTYHKCISQLVSYGYIVYKPSYNPLTGSFVELVIKPYKTPQ
jgi:hypothetical protein